jgi:two-component system sensor histidine kinase CpxA
MTRLYWRIFISFWLVIIMTVIVTVAVNSIAFRDEMENTRFSALRDSLDILSRQAQQALDEEGEDGLRDWLRARQEQQPFPPLLIINPAGEELLQRPLPAGLERLRPDARPFNRAGPNTRRARSPRIRRLEAADGQSYRMLVPGFRMVAATGGARVISAYPRVIERRRMPVAGPVFDAADPGVPRNRSEHCGG